MNIDTFFDLSEPWPQGVRRLAVGLAYQLPDGRMYWLKRASYLNGSRVCIRAWNNIPLTSASSEEEWDQGQLRLSWPDGKETRLKQQYRERLAAAKTDEEVDALLDEMETYWPDGHPIEVVPDPEPGPALYRVSATYEHELHEEWLFSSERRAWEKLDSITDWTEQKALHRLEEEDNGIYAVAQCLECITNVPPKEDDDHEHHS